MRIALTLLLVLPFVGWWNILRIVEHDSWPPPADAVTAAQAQQVTEDFIARKSVSRDDVAIPYAPTTASDPELFLDAVNFYPAMLDDLASARSSIHIIMFAFAPGEWGDRFADVLISQAQSGVDVRLSVDGQASKADGRYSYFYELMAEGGVHIVINDTMPLQAVGEFPDRKHTWSQDQVGRADHRKMMVIDGRIGWVGGAGFEDHFADGRWIDTFVRVEGDIVLQLQAVFCTSFHALGGSLPDDLTALFPPQENPGTIPVTLLQNIPGGFVPGTQASREVVKQSSRHLDIINPYFTDAGMVDRVIEAAHRGVDVRIITSRDSNNKPAQLALQSQYDRLIEAGVRIWEVPGVTHAKVTVADDTFIIGSINYDAWSLYRNLELSLMFDDPELASEAREMLISPMVARGQSITPWDDLGDQIPGRFWWWLRYFL